LYAILTDARKVTTTTMSSDLARSLKGNYPEATDAEVQRFAQAYSHIRGSDQRVQGIVATKLENYLDWRNCFGLDYEKEEGEDDSDTIDWKIAVRKAWHVEKSLEEARELAKKLANKLESESKMTAEEKIEADYDKELEKAITSNDDGNDEDEVNGEDEGEDSDVSNSEFVESDLDQVLFFHKTDKGSVICDNTGMKVLQVLPARINRKLAPARIYANVFAFYLDRKFNRKSKERVTILLDVRGGEGWPNPPAITMLNFIRVAVRVLEANFPERVEKFIVFPVPRVAMGLFNTCKRMFRSNTVGKFFLISGPAAAKSPLPRKVLAEHITEEAVYLTEIARLGLFKVKEEPRAWFRRRGGGTKEEKKPDDEKH
jgi:hypothetical protein